MKKLNVLILYDKYSTYTNTVFEHLSSFSDFSKHDHFFCHASNVYPIIDFDQFNVLVIHYSLRVAQGHINYRLEKKIRNFSGLKCIFAQDEYENTENLRKFILNNSFDIFYTCVPNQFFNQIYPKLLFKGVKLINTLTGFVPYKDFYDFQPSCIKDRTIIIGYRGNNLPFWYGDLGQEKTIIGETFKSELIDTDLSFDIETNSKYRIYGNQWVKFLSNCKATLGSESGSNIFDDHGFYKQSILNYLKKNPNADYLSVKKNILKNVFEEKIMNTISPKIFEAIKLKTALVLFEGNYSKVLIPDKHYIPLKKDFSNIKKVIEKLKDDNYLQMIADNAFNDIIKSEAYNYSNFIKNYDDLLLKNNINIKKIAHIIPNKVLLIQPKRIIPIKLPNFIRILIRYIPINLKTKLKNILVK